MKLTEHGADDLDRLRGFLLAVFEEVYHDRRNDPFFSPERYWERLTAYSTRDGFSVVTGEPAGYALGYTLPAGSRWWRGLQGDVDERELAEDGRRTFALCELMVREQHRRKGYARQLHDRLLAGRPEERATLLVHPDNGPANAAYHAWGWRQLGTVQPFDDSPVYRTMVRRLR